MANFPAVDMPEILHAISGGTRHTTTGTETGLFQSELGNYVSPPVNSYVRQNGTFMPGVARSGMPGYGYADDFYDRIHFFPHILSVGNLTRDEQYLIEIFNSYFYNVRVTRIQPENNQNIVGSGFELPALIKPLRSIIYNIFIAMEGPGEIDSVYHFEFDNSDVYDLQILGNRLVIFAFSPNWEDKVTETLSFMTDILEARDGTEQRIIMRSKPRYTIEYRILESDINQFDSYIVGWGSRTFILPLWWKKSKIRQAVNPGGNMVICDTVGFGFKKGDLVLLWRDYMQSEAAVIDLVTDNSITIESEFGKEYSYGYVMPTKLCRLAGDETSLETIQSNLFEAKVIFETVNPETIEPKQFENNILPYKHDYSSPRERGFTWKIIENDSKIGKPFKKYLRDNPLDYLELQDILLTSHEEVETFKSHLMYYFGSVKSFDVLIKESHFKVTKDITASSSFLFLSNNSYWTMEFTVNNRKRLFLQTIYGKRYIFNAVSFSQDFSGDILMNINTVFDQNIPMGDIQYMGFVVKVRFDQDDFEIEHELDILSRISLKLKGVLV